ncbi:hypothetical protein AVEN_134081-1 [Araneus ventricosus]|uniref:Uncharacterized protein n=1 Tax=Araneus ventricosus TaxID=182803 RepID=A0A4Y2RD23_ARAVE|nr:hypothetical protein AVEN_22204-1 [Araneus ventricosus]GBN73310.1 hypothetical protein AVEN_134081-1 [Araneus ventricosus]
MASGMGTWGGVLSVAVPVGALRKQSKEVLLPFTGRFLIGSLPIAMVLMTRLSENFCRSSPMLFPMLSCEHDNWSTFDANFTSMGYVVRIVKISVEFVDGLSSSKGVEIFIFP